ncbi:hypothetical protein ABS71_12890 [bacterium SCN 62-11]|nr:hypothetical protein [Candidatus Eremiobacteraeota bacterium]ODT64672.1 MAG: hypothetical protein ABS71_12890 [bacterium SCN 62-11]
MINTNPTIRPAVISVSNQPARASQAPASPSESFEPQLGFEPWIGPGKPGHPDPAVSPQPSAPPQPVVCPQPTMGFEPWQTGEATSTPAVSPRFSDKLVRAFGEQALTSIDDSRIQGCAGYYFDGLESVQPSQDWLTGVTVGRLGDQWEMTKPGTYELKTQGMGQILSFDMMNNQTVLESYYEVQSYETSRHREILRLDQDGTMRRETPPVGI